MANTKQCCPLACAAQLHSTPPMTTALVPRRSLAAAVPPPTRSATATHTMAPARMRTRTRWEAGVLWTRLPAPVLTVHTHSQVSDAFAQQAAAYRRNCCRKPACFDLHQAGTSSFLLTPVLLYPQQSNAPPPYLPACNCPPVLVTAAASSGNWDYCQTKTANGCSCSNTWAFSGTSYPGTCATGLPVGRKHTRIKPDTNWCLVDAGTCPGANQLDGYDYDVCTPPSGRLAVGGVPCQFPASYHGIQLYDCITYNHSAPATTTRPWCFTNITTGVSMHCQQCWHCQGQLECLYRVHTVVRLVCLHMVLCIIAIA